MHVIKKLIICLFFLIPIVHLKLQSADVINAAIEKNIGGFRYASLALRGNRDLVLRLLDISPYIFEHVSLELKADREVVLKAIAKDRYLLQFVSLELEQDPEIKAAARLAPL